MNSKTAVFLLSFIKRDFKTELSYKFNFFIHASGILFQIFLFYFIAKLVGTGAQNYLGAYGADYFTFVLVGIAFANYFGWAANHLSESIRTEQLYGTLENLFLAPAGNLRIIAGIYSWSFIMTTLEVAAYLIVGKTLLSASVTMPRLLPACLALSVSVLSLIPFGIASAAFIIVFKKGDIIGLATAYLFQILGGVYFPVEVLPDFLQKVSRLLPVTHILQAFRSILINGGPAVSIKNNIIYLLAFSAISLPLSLLFFNFALKRAKAGGSLSHY